MSNAPGAPPINASIAACTPAGVTALAVSVPVVVSVVVANSTPPTAVREAFGRV